jgi:hypothetical protein
MSNEKLVVVINGPPGCGKDAAVSSLRSDYPYDTSQVEFKGKLFEITSVIFGVSLYDLRSSWYTRKLKEQPREELKGLSPRQALIKVSEEVIKPNFGKSYFGGALAMTIKPGLTLVSDSGFVEELSPVIQEVGASNVLVIRVFGRGDYKGDSRYHIPSEWLEDSGVTYVDVFNTSTLADYLGGVGRAFRNWLEKSV